MSLHIIDNDIDNISSDCQKLHDDPKKSWCESQTTIDSPILQPLSNKFQTCCDWGIELFQSNQCYKFMEGYCPNGSTCNLEHTVKSVGEIVNQRKGEKNLTLVKQFPEILLLRKIRTNSFLC